LKHNPFKYNELFIVVIAEQDLLIMIVGLGMDIVEIGRIRQALERFGLHFMNKTFHTSEIAAKFSSECAILSAYTISHVAARFAAKEAGAKALGTGFIGGIRFQDIRIFSLASGKPEVVFYNKALERACELGVTHAHLSLTHAKDTAGAVVVLESLQTAKGAV
jgi:holo-[acyl-carrier protein] synthase